MSIVVKRPGLLTTVQDLGREEYQQFGVSVAGAMDPRAAAIANILVGNASNEAVLECTLVGPELLFKQSVLIAVTGGDLGPMLDGVPIATYSAIWVEAGQTLQFLGLKTGCRAYIAFSGGLNIPVVMGSRSTDLRAKLGGLKGRKLEAGDVIDFRATDMRLKVWTGRRISPEFVPRRVYLLRVVLGPQSDAFTSEGLHIFLSQQYSVTHQSDRMGCRLNGKPVEHKKSADIISDGITFGSIQIPSSGQPIIMLADRQTIGGYTKIATVITADFRILGQLKGGDQVRFEAVSIEKAQDALLTQQAALRQLRHALDNCK